MGPVADQPVPKCMLALESLVPYNFPTHTHTGPPPLTPAAGSLLPPPPPILIPSPHPPAPPRRQFDPSFQVQNLPPSVLGNAGCWALHMGVSSNLRYQILGGLDPVRMCLGRTLWSL